MKVKREVPTIERDSGASAGLTMHAHRASLVLMLTICVSQPAVVDGDDDDEGGVYDDTIPAAEQRAANMVGFCCGILGAIGSLFTIVVYVLLPAARQDHSFMILNVALYDLMVALLVVLGGPSAQLFTRSDRSLLCRGSVFVLSWGYYGSLAWTSLVAGSLVRIMDAKRTTHVSGTLIPVPAQLCVGHLCPIGVAVSVAVTVRDETINGKCLFTNSSTTQNLYRRVVVYGIVCATIGAVAWNCSAYVRVRRRLRNIARMMEWAELGDPSELHRKMAAMVFYPLLSVVVYAPAALTSILASLGRTDATRPFVFWLAFVQPGMGLLNAVAYGLNPTTKAAIAASCCPRTHARHYALLSSAHDDAGLPTPLINASTDTASTDIGAPTASTDTSGPTTSVASASTAAAGE